VTAFRNACAVCGAEIVPAATGRPRQTCSNACRQRAYRERAEEPFRLTPELRELLHLAIDRRVREKLREVDAEGIARDRLLFEVEA
jgi:hypothetical protein